MQLVKTTLDHISKDDYTHSFFFKFLTVSGGTSAVYHVRDWLPDWAASTIETIMGFDWMSWFGALALILLVVERVLLVRLRRIQIKNAKENGNVEDTPKSD